MHVFPHGIDLNAPGGLAALFAFNRARFGDAVMEADPDAAAKAAADAAQKAAEAAVNAASGDDDEQLGEGGKKALKAERDARSKAEKELAEARAALQEIEDAKLSDIERAKKERDEIAAETATLRTENARLAALATYPVPEKYQHLVIGTDEASFLASAKDVSELAAAATKGTGVVSKSGTGSGGKPIGGSISEHRRQIAERKQTR